MIQQLIHLYYHTTYKGGIKYMGEYADIVGWTMTYKLRAIGYWPHEFDKRTWPKLIEFIMEQKELQ